MIGTIQPIQKATPTAIKEIIISSKERTAFIEKIFASFKNVSSRSQPAKDYLQQRNLDLKKLEVGYNGGQFHHGQRKEDSLIQNCLAYGLLIDNNRKGNTGEIVYTIFGKYGIVFPLKNQKKYQRFMMNYNTHLCKTAWGKKFLARVTKCTCFCFKNRDRNFFRSVGQEC